MKRIGAWKQALAVTSVAAVAGMRRAAEKATMKEAQLLRKMILEELAQVGPPLAPSTLAVRERGGKKPLISTGDLRASIKVHKLSREKVFVGILKSAKGKNGQLVANIAAGHEFGFKTIVVEITPRMRRFLMAKFRNSGFASSGGFAPPGGGTNIAIITIPKRPIFEPAFARLKPDEVKKRFQRNVLGALLGG